MTEAKNVQFIFFMFPVNVFASFCSLFCYIYLFYYISSPNEKCAITGIRVSVMVWKKILDFSFRIILFLNFSLRFFNFFFYFLLFYYNSNALEIHIHVDLLHVLYIWMSEICFATNFWISYGLKFQRRLLRIIY